MSLADELLEQLQLQRGDWEITGRPALSTSAPSLRPDLAEGSDNHDAGLDQQLADVAPHAPAPASGPTVGEQRAEGDVDASLARANAEQLHQGAGEQLVSLPPLPPHDPALDLLPPPDPT